MDEDTERRLVEHIRRAGPAYAGFPWDEPEPLQLDASDPRWAVEATSETAPVVGPPFDVADSDDDLTHDLDDDLRDDDEEVSYMSPGADGDEDVKEREVEVEPEVNG